MSARMVPISADSGSSSSEDTVERTSWTARRIGITGIGLSCLVACGIAVTFTSRLGHQKNGESMITARALLQSDEMISAQARNQINILKLDADEAEVRMAVAKSIKKIEDRMKASERRKLQELELTREQKDAMLRIVSSIGDPRVQELGFKVAKAVHDGFPEGHDGVRRRLQAFSKDDLSSMRQLKNELFHGLHKELSEGSDVALDVDSIRFLKIFPDDGPSDQEIALQQNIKSRRLFLEQSQDQNDDANDTSTTSTDDGRGGAWDAWGRNPNTSAPTSTTAATTTDGTTAAATTAATTAAPTISTTAATVGTTTAPHPSVKLDEATETSASSPGSMGGLDDMAASSDTVEEALDFFGGIEDQTRVILDQIDFVGTSFGWDSKIPSVAKSGVAGLDFVTNVADCVSRADGNDVKEGMCPFKYGSAAFDAMACLDNIMGVANARAGLTNENGYDIWDDVSSSNGLKAPSPSMSNMFDSVFGSSPTPAPNSQVFPWN